MPDADQQAMLAAPSPQVILQAIAHPLRRKILGWLKDAIRYFPQQAYGREFGVCAGQIVLRCGLAQSTVSQHLAVLKRAALIEEQKIGPVHFFTRNEVTLQRFTHQLIDLLTNPLTAKNHPTARLRSIGLEPYDCLAPDSMNVSATQVAKLEGTAKSN